MAPQPSDAALPAMRSPTARPSPAEYSDYEAGAGSRGFITALRSGSRAGAASIIATAIVAAMAWLIGGRLDATWPARNVLEAHVRSLTMERTVQPAAVEQPPGSIVGRVTWRTMAPTSCHALGSPGEGSASLAPYPGAGGTAAVLGETTPGAGGTLAILGDPLRRCDERLLGERREPWTLQDLPIPEAVVLVVDAEGNAVEARTDGSGAYVLGGLDPGRYRVLAAAPGFAPSVVDRTPDATQFARLVAWALPGVAVEPNGVATVPISLERPQPPLTGAFARDVDLRDSYDQSGISELVACGATGGATIVARRAPIRLVGALADAPVASLRQYGPPPSRPDDSSDSAAVGTGAVVAVVPVGSEEHACAAIALASRGVDVIVAGIAPDPRLERQVLAVRTLLAALRTRHRSIGEPVARGPVVVGAGFASAITMRAVSDEAADVAMDWAGVGVNARQTNGSAAVDRIAQRKVAVARRVGGVVLVAPVLDLLAVRRDLPILGLPGWLAEAAIGLGPADRELPRYVRYSARFAADSALPPVLVVPGAPVGGHQDSVIAEWVRFAGGAGASVEVLSTTDVGQASATVRWDDEATVIAVVDRVAKVAGAL